MKLQLNYFSIVKNTNFIVYIIKVKAINLSNFHVLISLQNKILIKNKR